MFKDAFLLIFIFFNQTLKPVHDRNAFFSQMNVLRFTRIFILEMIFQESFVCEWFLKNVYAL